MRKTHLWTVLGVMVCAGMLLVLIRIFLVPKDVSDDDLRLLYATHKAECELLKQMFLEDAAKTRWQRFVVVPTDKTGAELDGIEPARFEQYGALLKRLQVISLHGEKDHVFFIVRRVGWAGEGRWQGLAWMEKPVSESGKVYGKSRFVHIEDGWYFIDLHQ